jgi:hypothetical protein
MESHGITNTHSFIVPACPPARQIQQISQKYAITIKTVVPQTVLKLMFCRFSDYLATKNFVKLESGRDNKVGENFQLLMLLLFYFGVTADVQE